MTDAVGLGGVPQLSLTGGWVGGLGFASALVAVPLGGEGAGPPLPLGSSAGDLGGGLAVGLVTDPVGGGTAGGGGVGVLMGGGDVGATGAGLPRAPVAVAVGGIAGGGAEDEPEL